MKKDVEVKLPVYFKVVYLHDIRQIWKAIHTSKTYKSHETMIIGITSLFEKWVKMTINFYSGKTHFYYLYRFLKVYKYNGWIVYGIYSDTIKDEIYCYSLSLVKLFGRWFVINHKFIKR